MIQVESSKAELSANISSNEAVEVNGSRNPLPASSGSSLRSSRSPPIRISANPVINRETGTIPKRSDRPNISMSRPPDITSGRSSNTPVVMPRASPVVAFPPPPVNNNEGNSAASNNGIQTSSMNHQQIQQIQNQLENITVIVQSLNQSIESLTENFNRRLNQLDSRINSMAATASTCNAVSSHAGPSASSSPSHDVIRTLIAQQRQVSHTHPPRSVVSLYCNLTH